MGQWTPSGIQRTRYWLDSRVEYFALQLHLFAEGTRGGSPYPHLMRPIAPRLTDQQRQDAPAYYASLSR